MSEVEKRATDVLIALACCSFSELSCRQCPLYNDDFNECMSWDKWDIIEAVDALSGKDFTDG